MIDFIICTMALFIAYLLLSYVESSFTQLLIQLVSRSRRCGNYIYMVNFQDYMEYVVFLEYIYIFIYTNAKHERIIYSPVMKEVIGCDSINGR